MIRLTVAAKICVTEPPLRLLEVVRKELTLPNPEYRKRERLGKWIGDIERTVTLLEEGEGVIRVPRGYLARILKILDEAGEAYELKDMRLRLPDVPLEFAGALREYQLRAVEDTVKRGSGILVGPCGCGKTVMGCALLSRWKQPATVLCHTKELLTQWRDSIRRFLSVEPGLVGAGDATLSDAVNVALVQTLTARPELLDDLTRRTGLVLLDECHHCPADTFTGVVQAFPAVVRYGLSATPIRSDGLTTFMTAVIGPYRAMVTQRELEAAGVRVTPEVRFVRTGAAVRNVVEDWPGAMRTLAENGARNRLIRNVVQSAVDKGRSVLLLVGLVEHAEYLGGELGSVARVLHGRMAKKARERALQDVREGEASVLIGTQIADEGLDLPGLDTLVLAVPTRSPGRTEQRVGRILRNCEGKRRAIVFDLVDEHPVFYGQARSRFFEAYRRLAPETDLPDWLDGKRRVA